MIPQILFPRFRKIGHGNFYVHPNISRHKYCKGTIPLDKHRKKQHLIRSVDSNQIIGITRCIYLSIINIIILKIDLKLKKVCTRMIPMLIFLAIIILIFNLKKIKFMLNLTISIDDS